MRHGSRSLAQRGSGERRSSVTVSAASDSYFDPYDMELNADPYPMFRRLRDGAPLYYNEQHDFYALSRFDDVDRAIVGYQTFSSAKGAILEIIKANIDIPPRAGLGDNAGRSELSHVRR
jgi:cytochrome P450